MCVCGGGGGVGGQGMMQSWSQREGKRLRHGYIIVLLRTHSANSAAGLMGHVPTDMLQCILV